MVAVASLAVFALILHTAVGQTCNCFERTRERKVTFKECGKKSADWRNHTHIDVQLVGDCLPSVPVNEMKCFKWRMAEQCTKGHHLRCLLKPRPHIEEEFFVTPNSVTIFSPGFNNKVPVYYNYNFCIYNVSLDCSDYVINVSSKSSTDPFADEDTCQDYLWLQSTGSNEPPKRICGSQIVGFHTTLSSSSFTAVLWSNKRDSFGNFELEASCTDIPRPDKDSEQDHDSNADKKGSGDSESIDHV